MIMCTDLCSTGVGLNIIQPIRLRFLFILLFCLLYYAVIITIFISRAFFTSTVSFLFFFRFLILYRSLCPQLRTHIHTHTLALSVSAAFLKRFCFRPLIPLWRLLLSIFNGFSNFPAYACTCFSIDNTVTFWYWDWMFCIICFVLHEKVFTAAFYSFTHTHIETQDALRHLLCSHSWTLIRYGPPWWESRRFPLHSIKSV